MPDLRVEWVEIAGKSIPAEKVVCPYCKTLDLHTDFDTSSEPWIATCPNDHEWEIKTVADA